jgi:hypothetical protein
MGTRQIIYTATREGEKQAAVVSPKYRQENVNDGKNGTFYITFLAEWRLHAAYKDKYCSRYKGLSRRVNIKSRLTMSVCIHYI